MESRGQMMVKCALQEANNHARKKEITKFNSNKNTLNEDILDGKKTESDHKSLSDQYQKEKGPRNL